MVESIRQTVPGPMAGTSTRVVTPSTIPYILYYAGQVRKSVILHGPPGIGKSVSVMDAIRALNPGKAVVDIAVEEPPAGTGWVGYIYLNVNTMLPIDISGIPDKYTVDDRTVVRYMPMEWWIRCLKADKCYVIIDEYNTTNNPDMVATVMRLLSECRAGMVDLGCSRGKTQVIAMGNPPEHSAIANPPPAPILGGKAIVVSVSPPSLREWVEYMSGRYGSAWNRAVSTFLMENKEYFIKIPEGEPDEPYPTPRGWDAVARLLALDGVTPDQAKPMIAGLVGWDAASSLVAYMSAIMSVTLDDVLKESDPFTRMVKLARLVVAGGLEGITREDAKYILRNVTPSNAEAVEMLAIALRLNAIAGGDNSVFYDVMDSQLKGMVLGTRASIEIGSDGMDVLEEF